MKLPYMGIFCFVLGAWGVGGGGVAAQVLCFYSPTQRFIYKQPNYGFVSFQCEASPLMDCLADSMMMHVHAVSIYLLVCE